MSARPTFGHIIGRHKVEHILALNDFSQISMIEVIEYGYNAIINNET